MAACQLLPKHWSCTCVGAVHAYVRALEPYVCTSEPYVLKVRKVAALAIEGYRHALRGQLAITFKAFSFL